MKISVVKELKEGEGRVAETPPKTLKNLSTLVMKS